MRGVFFFVLSCQVGDVVRNPECANNETDEFYFEAYHLPVKILVRFIFTSRLRFVWRKREPQVPVSSSALYVQVIQGGDVRLLSIAWQRNTI